MTRGTTDDSRRALAISRSTDFKVTIVLVLFVAVLIAYSALSNEFSVFAFSSFSLWLSCFLLGNLAFASWHLCRHVNFSAVSFLGSKETLLVISSSLFLTMLCTTIIEPTFTILPDESRLISVSRSLFRSGEPSVLLQALKHDDTLEPIEEVLPIRPVLFPVLVLPLHTIFGYHFQNALILNTVLFFSLVAGVGSFALRTAGLRYAVIAQLFVASQPLLISSAMSASFDFLALLLLMLVLCAFFIDLRVRHTSSAYFLWIALLLFSTSRYESPLIAAIIGAFLLIVHRSSGLRRVGHLFLYPLSFLGVLPVIWQFVVSDRNSLSDSHGVRFSWEYLAAHSLGLFESALTYLPPFNPVTTVACFFGFIVAAVHFFGSARSPLRTRRNYLPVLLGTVCTTSLAVLFMAYWSGGIDQVGSGRFYLSLVTAISVVPVISCVLVGFKRRTSVAFVFFLGTIAFGVGLYQVKEARYFSMVSPIELKLLNHYIDSLPPNSRSVFAYHRAVSITMRDEPAVKIEQLNLWKEQLLELHRDGQMKTLIIFQRYSPRHQRPFRRFTLPSGFTTELVSSHPVGNLEFRILKVTKIDDVAL